MKKQKKLFIVSGLLLVLFTVASIFLFQRCRARIEEGYLASEGSAAENFAVLLSKSIHLTDAQVDKLKNCSYQELLDSEENNNLEYLVSDRNFAVKVDYAYIMVHLKENEVKYSVTEENQERFHAPVGTKLDILWLLDVNVSESAEENKLSEVDDALTRYSYYIDEDALIFGEKPSYIYNASEWGDHICGYAPLYSEEGAYIGVVGVDLQTGDYEAYCGNAVRMLGILMLVSLFLLGIVFFYIYYQNKTLQLEKTYTDILTGLQNRSYYTDCFAKCMNARKKHNPIFVMMIADVDFFKKVNDTFGHEIGDQVLIEMGEILLASFDKKQIFRFGGEEFVAGFWIENEEQLHDKMEKLFLEIKNHKFTNLEIHITISAGCSYYTPEAVDGWLMSGMLKAADCKLYECKENGRNQYRIEKFDSEKEYVK